MKRKGMLSLLIAILMIFSVFSASCSSTPKTVEEYVKNNDKAAEELVDKSGMDIEFKENDIILTLDLSTFDQITDEVAKSDIMKDQLGAVLDTNTDHFSGMCKSFEEESKIEGIQIIVNYKYGDEVILTKTFNSSGVVN